MIRTYLSDLGWPDPIEADSGNCAQLTYRIDVPANDENLIACCLAALAKRFDDDDVKIDQSVSNPAQLWKLYGTLACKGDSTTERHHRMARILHVPDQVQIVDRCNSNRWHRNPKGLPKKMTKTKAALLTTTTATRLTSLSSSSEMVLT